MWRNSSSTYHACAYAMQYLPGLLAKGVASDVFGKAVHYNQPTGLSGGCPTLSLSPYVRTYNLQHNTNPFEPKLWYMEYNIELLVFMNKCVYNYVVCLLHHWSVYFSMVIYWLVK